MSWHAHWEGQFRRFLGARHSSAESHLYVEQGLEDSDVGAATLVRRTSWLKIRARTPGHRTPGHRTHKPWVGPGPTMWSEVGTRGREGRRGTARHTSLASRAGGGRLRHLSVGAKLNGNRLEIRSYPRGVFLRTGYGESSPRDGVLRDRARRVRGGGSGGPREGRPGPSCTGCLRRE